MTTTFPSPAPSATTKLPVFAVGTVVRVQHNTSLFKIHSHAAWSDDDHQTPTCYNLTGPSGRLHKMVPVERLILRADRGLSPGRYGDSLIVKRSSVDKEEMREMVIAADQLLCGLNTTRHSYNSRIREIRSLQGNEKPWHPVAGDRLICLRNDRGKHIFNGSLWEASSTMYAGGPANILKIRVKSLDEEDRLPIDVKTPEAYFNGTEKDLDWPIRRSADEFTFGWAITCHKAQGSQWDNPLIFDESSCFRKDAVKWLYTAITRAAKRVTVVV